MKIDINDNKIYLHLFTNVIYVNLSRGT